MRSTVKLLIALGILVSLPMVLSMAVANAQSFSCAKAQTSVEFAICNDEDLINLDENLAVIFDHSKASLQTIPQRQQFSREHQVWMLKRNRCELDWTCLKARYNERIKQLKVKL